MLAGRLARRYGPLAQLAAGVPGALAGGVGGVVAGQELRRALHKRASDLRIDIVYRAAQCGETIEKTAAAQYFHDLRKPDTDKEMLGQKFCKLARGIKKDPWELALEVADNFPAYAVLSKTASDPRVKELAEFYLDWSDDMEKTAFLGALTSAGKMSKAIKAIAAPAAKKAVKSAPKKWTAGDKALGATAVGGVGLAGYGGHQLLSGGQQAPAMGYR